MGRRSDAYMCSSVWLLESPESERKAAGWSVCRSALFEMFKAKAPRSENVYGPMRRSAVLDRRVSFFRRCRCSCHAWRPPRLDSTIGLPLRSAHW